ncbi:hypothetical protein [Achromobacter aegrifaciens]
MAQQNAVKNKARRRMPDGRRFWFISLLGIIVTCSPDILDALRGQFGLAQRLVIPALLLYWLYRGSEWARWILMVLLLGIGAMNLYLLTGMLKYSAHLWLHAYVASAAMVLTGFYLALAKKDFTRYCSHVAVRNARKAAARQAEPR